MKGATRVQANGPEPYPLITCMADVEPQEVSWFWHPYIAYGKLTILEGDPGLGKTFIALTLAAAATRGTPLPSEADSAPGASEPFNVIYMSAEDGLADTLRPRLDAVGADASRVFALTGWSLTDEQGKTTTGAVTLADIPLLEKTLQRYQPRLIIVDPLQAYLGAGVDMHRANEVRPVLSALGDLAEKYGCAIVGIRHLAKSASSKAIYSGMGSIDFGAAARSILQVGEHDNERLLAHVKSNLAPKGRSVRYEVKSGTLNWSGFSDLTAQDLQVPPSAEIRVAREDAKAFLYDYLAAGPAPADHIKKSAREEGISAATLRRAQQEVGVRSQRENVKGSTRGHGEWVWYLPDEDASPPKGAPEHLEHLEEKSVLNASFQDAQGE